MYIYIYIHIMSIYVQDAYVFWMIKFSSVYQVLLDWDWGLYQIIV